MIEFPKIGEGVETEVRENMVFSLHPHAIAPNGEDCLYMQETWLVTPEGGAPLSSLPMQVFTRPGDGSTPRRGYNRAVSWPWLVLLVFAAALVVAVEWPRLGRRFGAEARRARQRKQRKRSYGSSPRMTRRATSSSARSSTTSTSSRRSRSTTARPDCAQHRNPRVGFRSR